MRVLGRKALIVMFVTVQNDVRARIVEQLPEILHRGTATVE